MNKKCTESVAPKFWLRLLNITSLLIVVNVASGQSNELTKVLFVGNSYTYFWNLPQNVALMAEDQGVKISTQQSTAGGVTWGQHWRSERGLDTRSLIQSGDFDIVILQNHSKRAIEHPDSMMHYGQLFHREIKQSGAQTMLYMTWAREWDPTMMDPIAEKYNELGRSISVPVLPVGLAWQKAKQMRPDLDLYDPDGSHPSTTGTYLTACVIYTMLTKKSPIGIAHRLAMKDENGEKLYINIQSPEDALFCQKIAHLVANDYLD